MRELAAGFDPYQKAWSAYDHGLEKLNQIEAPVFVYTPEEALANALAERYKSEGLQPADLRSDYRWMVLPDAKPVAKIHLNVVGGRQVRYGLANRVEKDVMSELTSLIEEHVREVVKPSRGVGVYRFGEEVPTTHQHVVARQNSEDGLDWTNRPPLSTLEARRTMREEVSLDLVQGAEATIRDHLGGLLLDAVNR